MDRTQGSVDGHPHGEVVDFDEALLAACAPGDRADLMWEAEMLARAFAPRGAPGELRRMAAQLSAGQRDIELGRHHARRLAAALKHLANAA